MKEFYHPGFNCHDFDRIQVPGHIQIQGYDRMQYVNTQYPWDGTEFLRPPQVSEDYNPVGSYVRFFELDEGLKGKSIAISFQGVETAFYVWLNGYFVGYSEDTFTPSEFDLDEYLVEGENKLAVEVYKHSSASWIEDQDFWRFSGIFRDVYLYALPESHAEDVSVRAILDETYRNGLLEVQVKLTGRVQGDVGFILKDTMGQTVFAQTVPNSQSVRLLREIPNVKAWSAEEPNLYTLYIHLFDEAHHVVEVIPVEVGFRTFEMKNGIMCI